MNLDDDLRKLSDASAKPEWACFDDDKMSGHVSTIEGRAVANFYAMTAQGDSFPDPHSARFAVALINAFRRGDVVVSERVAKIDAMLARFVDAYEDQDISHVDFRVMVANEIFELDFKADP